MKRVFLAAWITVSLGAAGAAAQDSHKRPMTTDDQLNMVELQAALLSPDGQWVLYSTSELDWKENKRKTKYYRISSSGGSAYQFIGEEGGRSFQFSPRGTYLSFLRQVGSGDDKRNQVFWMRTDGGEATQLTKHDNPVSSFDWSEDESKIFFTADEPLSEADKKERKKGADAIAVDEGPNGQGNGEWNNLWVFDVAARQESRISEERFIIGDFDVSPDASRVAFTARTENRRNQGYLSEIYLVNVQDKLKTRLTENRAPERGLSWAPDGKSFAYRAPDDREWELRNDKIWIMDADTGEHRLASGDFIGSIQRGYYWSPDGKSIYFTGLQRTDTNLFRLDVETGEVSQITHAVGNLVVESMSKDTGRFLYGRSDFDTPQDLYAASVADPEQETRLTDVNPWVEKDLLLAQGQVIRWKSSDGLEIEGLLFLPPGYRQGTRVPLMLNVHGGPAGVFTNHFEAGYHVYSGLGWASLCPNVRGSSGYSDELLRGNMHDIGGGDYQDLMTGVDAVIQRGWADSDRMGIKGWSYGGILGGWTITQTDRFKAASLGAMVTDWTSEYGPGFNYDVRLWYIGGTPWENPDRYRRQSSLSHIANVTTPTILFHGMRDTTDTEAQSMNFFQALKDRGIEARYLRFPREPHGFREPRHQRTRLIEEIRWMQKHVLGQDWTPWERPASEKGDKSKQGAQDVEPAPKP